MSAMTADTLTAPATREFGVRYRPLGDTHHIVELYPEAWQAEDRLEALTGHGHTDITIVARTVTAWQIAPEGLSATVLALAEIHADEEIDDDTARTRLAGWLGRDVDWQAWQDLLHAIGELRRAEDGDVDWNMVDPELRDIELLVPRLEGLVEDAVRTVIGNGA